MDHFDFSAPINATIIYDDSDDEIIEKKPSTEILRMEENETTVDSPKVEEEQKVNKKHTEDNLLKRIYYTPKTETCASAEHDIENFTHKLVKYRKPVKSKKNKNHVLQQKPLDMPSLEEKINSVVNDERNIEIQNERDLPKQNKTVLKRTLPGDFGISDKPRKARRTSAKNTCKELENIHLINENNRNEHSKEDCNAHNPTYTSNGTQKQDSSVAIYSNNFVSSNQNLSNKEASPIQLPNQYIETAKTNLTNVEINPPIEPIEQALVAIDQAQPNGKRSSQSLNVSTKTVANCMQGLLDTVSEHMIYILNSYHAYVKLVQTNADPRLINEAKNRYINNRGHFFDLSYSSVLNIIIPKNNTPTFVTKFINSTFRMAHSKFSCRQIEMLYTDMITWVQKRQMQIQNINTTVTDPILFQGQPCSRPPIPQQNDQVQNGIPGSLKINHSSQSRPQYESMNGLPISHKPNQHGQPSPALNLLHSIPQTKPPPYPSQSQQNLERPALNGYYFQSDRIAKQNKAQPTHFSQQNVRNHYENQVPNTNQNTLLETMNDIVHQRTVIQPYSNYNNQVQGTLQQIPATSPSWLNLRKQTRQKQAPETWQNYSLPSYSQNIQNNPAIVPSQKNHHVQDLQPEIANQVELNRSSISRDSGFMSPLNFNTNIDLQEESQAQSSTPLITHVTSLNPNASLIEDGNCSVCGKITKQKCLGCFSCYYCSHGCQFQDWKIHQLVCK